MPKYRTLKSNRIWSGKTSLISMPKYRSLNQI
uniref:Uncharacterized protein n=1 Tax=Arundo donax TaxID=35708 RepID=A0A0A9C816_ARUDO